MDLQDDYDENSGTLVSESPAEPWPKKLRGQEILHVISGCLDEGRFGYDNHCKIEAANDNILLAEVRRVLESGVLVSPANPGATNPRWNKNSRPPEWSYELRALIDDRWIHVVVRMRNDDGMPFALCYTCWVKES